MRNGRPDANQRRACRRLKGAHTPWHHSKGASRVHHDLLPACLGIATDRKKIKFCNELGSATIHPQALAGARCRRVALDRTALADDLRAHALTGGMGSSAAHGSERRSLFDLPRYAAALTPAPAARPARAQAPPD